MYEIVIDEVKTPFITVTMWLLIEKRWTTTMFDTGSALTLLRGALFDEIRKQSDKPDALTITPLPNLHLVNASGQDLKIRGYVRVPCKIMSAVGFSEFGFTVNFVIVEDLVQECLFGAAEIGQFDILVDVNRKTLVVLSAKPPVPIALIGASQEPQKSLKQIRKRLFPYEQSHHHHHHHHHQNHHHHHKDESDDKL